MQVTTPTVVLPASSAISQPAKAIDISQATYDVIEKLVAERQAWQDTVYRTSNEQLYAILQKCYGLYKSMEGSTAEAKALREGLQKYVEANKYTFTKSAHTITKIVKCVFGIDRRRVSAYSIVLRTALARNIGVLDIAKFISDEGGVEEVRLAKAPNAMSTKQKAQVASSTVVVNDIGTVSSPALSAMLDAGKIGANTVLIGTWQADGSVVIRTVVESDTVLSLALASHYSTIKVAAKAQAAESKAAGVSEVKQDAIAQAAASASVDTSVQPVNALATA